MMTEMKGLTRKESPCHPHGEDVCQASSAHGEKKRQECPPPSPTPIPFSLNTSGDTLLLDIRRILGKPIIVLARQAPPTHN